MADITDPVAVAFVETELRPIAEVLRELKHRLADMMLRWNHEILAEDLIPDDPTAVVLDGQVRQVCGDKVHSVMARLAALQTQLDSPGVDAALSHCAVRPAGCRVSLNSGN